MILPFPFLFPFCSLWAKYVPREQMNYITVTLTLMAGIVGFGSTGAVYVLQVIELT